LKQSKLRQWVIQTPAAVLQFILTYNAVYACFRRHNGAKTLASERLDSPCGRIGGGFAAARQAQLAANAPKREFHATFVGGHMS
jgi:hypothetical protein